MRKFNTTHPLVYALLVVLATANVIFIIYTNALPILTHAAIESIASIISILTVLVAVVLSYYSCQRAVRKDKDIVVLVSYSHVDTEPAHEIADRLQNSGYTVVLANEQVGIGGNIRDTIDQLVKSADVVVAIVS